MPVCQDRMDRNFKYTKRYILKLTTTLLSFCLLFTPFANAKQELTATETSVPGSSEIHEPAGTPTPPPPAIPPKSPESTAIQESVPAAGNEINTLADYPLAPGDTLEISVWKEEGLQDQPYLIAPDGTIIFPLIGTVLAAGKTITQLKETLTTKLADFISEPSITVKLTNNQGNSVFVIGKVNKPGQYFSGRKLDVLQALSLAGGLTVFADDNSISILRRIGNQTKVFPFDYSNVIQGEDLEQNIQLEPGDTVTVP